MIYGIIKDEDLCEMERTAKSNIPGNNKSQSQNQERPVQQGDLEVREEPRGVTSDKSQQTEEAPEPGKQEEELQSTLVDKKTTRDLLARRLRNSENGERLVELWCEAACSELQAARRLEFSLLAAVNADALRVFELQSRVEQDRARLSLLQARLSARLEDAARERQAVLRQNVLASKVESLAKVRRDEDQGGDGACNRVSKIEKVEQENAKLRAAIKEKKSTLKKLQKLLATNLAAICVVEDESRWADQKATLTNLRDELATEERRRQLVVLALQRMYDETHEGAQHEREQAENLRRQSEKLVDLHRQISVCDEQRLHLERETQRSVDAAYLELWLLAQQHPGVQAVLDSRLNQHQMPPLPSSLPVWLLPPLPPSSLEFDAAESAERNSKTPHSSPTSPSTSPLGSPTQSSTPKLGEEDAKTPPTHPPAYHLMTLTPAPFTPGPDPRLSDSLSPGSVYHGRPVLGNSWSTPRLNITS